MKREIVTTGLSDDLYQSFRLAFDENDIWVCTCKDIDEIKAKTVQEIIMLIIVGALDLTTCRVQAEIRMIRQFSHVPILAIVDIDNIAPIIEDGADSCVPSNMNVSSILATAMALIRRESIYSNYKEEKMKSALVTRGDLVIDPVLHRVTLSGKEIYLQSREFRLLLYFAQNPGVLVTPKTIYEIVWDKENAYNRNVVPVISELRHKLNDNRKNPTYIETVHGFGYRFLPKK